MENIKDSSAASVDAAEEPVLLISVFLYFHAGLDQIDDQADVGNQ